MKKVEENRKKVLIVVAHPDDEVLGCGATIARLVSEGYKAYCLFLGNGKASRYEKMSSKLKQEQAVLRKEAQGAADMLGISKIYFKDYPDQQYETVPFLNIVKSVEEIKNKIQPGVIFTHHRGDLNLDHQIVFKAVLTACRPVKGECVKDIYSFAVLSSTEWNASTPFVPNVFVGVEDTFHQNTLALKAYKSETREFPHPRSEKALKINAQRWGSVVGKNLVEAFELIRGIV